MLQVHFMQQWFTLSDPAMEDAFFDVPLYRAFAQLDANARMPGCPDARRKYHPALSPPAGKAQAGRNYLTTTSSMTCYCTLHISSRDKAVLPAELFLASSSKAMIFVDQETPTRRASRARLHAQGILSRPDLPRYGWQLDTNGRVKGDTLHEHLNWIVGRLRSGKLLVELKTQNYDYWFSIFWGGNGTGGGPLITREATAILTRHDAPMGVGFYYE